MKVSVIHTHRIENIRKKATKKKDIHFGVEQNHPAFMFFVLFSPRLCDACYIDKKKERNKTTFSYHLTRNERQFLVNTHTHTWVVLFREVSSRLNLENKVKNKKTH